ncbi:MAG: hypothetical protein Q8Q60_00950 [Candidatus Chromulinivorax sp.]|nr:hypothetical protein [Candidatus Chromulinivorax sp.]
MVLKNNKLWLGIFFLCLSSIISANITTLQYWDPAPFFNAANLNMPPDTMFCYGVKKRMLDEDADRHRRWGINVSPFVQRAIRAQQSDSIFFGVHGDASITAGQQMSDFQGTASLMGLFLGPDINGYSIWGPPGSADTGLVTDITTATVAATQLQTNLQSAVNAINDNVDATTYPTAVIYNPITAYNPSILSQAVLETDKIYFGAFSTPLTYQKAGFRWELNFDFSDHVGFIARGGLCQITQRVFPTQDLSANSSIYTGLLNVTTYAGSAPTPEAQNTFNEWVPNNIDDLLDSTNGANYDVTTFSDTGIEDIQLLAFFRHSFPIHPADPDQYASVILTPYAMIGWTVPIAPVRDYSKLYALPFGNNSHTSVGGVVGLTFDFIDSIEFGFEFGATGFLKKTISDLPMPNHMLQRVIYPYRQDVTYSPGFNGQFAAIFNAYEFAQNTSFSLRYNYIQHNQDTITLVTPSVYFLPSQLEEQSPWTSQMFIAALTFEIQPAVFISVAWQGALSQKNAYCSNTIMGSLNFMF